MDRPLLLPLAACTEPSLVGGKAIGLARLLAGGFRGPPGILRDDGGICSRTFLRGGYFSSAYEWHDQPSNDPGRTSTILPTSRRIRSEILKHCGTEGLRSYELDTEVKLASHWDTVLWAVRSSATNEDAAHASFAGVYRTHLGVPLKEISRWSRISGPRSGTNGCSTYHERSASSCTPPAMAVVIQPLLEAQAAGVVYSVHPLTGRATQVMINAVAGLAAALVDGSATPDQYVVDIDRERSAHAYQRTDHQSGRLRRYG